MREFLMSLILVVLIFPAQACSEPQLPSKPPEGMDVSWFHDDCAPWDGPATTLYLGTEVAESVFTPTFPFLRLSLYSSSTQFKAGKRLQFDLPGSPGFAQYCVDADHCLSATAVRIDFLNVDAQHLEGRLEVVFETRLPIRGSFRASRIEFQALCG